MWWKWFPWKFLVRNAARRQGFIDPIEIFAQLENFAQPSEVKAPTELIRSGVIFHARGLMNSLAIQHNLDWIWPYWVECQYDPLNDAFIPRSFSLTQINLTHRNWTALGVPGGTEFPLVDPRGLVTPFYDSWSIDVWIVSEEGEHLIPSRVPNVSQKMALDDNISVITVSKVDQLKLRSEAEAIGPVRELFCRVKVTASAAKEAKLVVSIRPYNPEGVSFVNNITLLEDCPGWRVNREKRVSLDKPPEKYVFSSYQEGDVYSSLSTAEKEKGVTCKVGLASSAALYRLEAGRDEEIIISVPLSRDESNNGAGPSYEGTARSAWKESLQGASRLQIPDDRFQFLYEAALYTMVLHSPREVYPGPYIYRRFWFRDAAFILFGLLCAGIKGRVLRALDCFRARQTAQGYFLSQEGEWDSNGEALWIMRRYCEMTGDVPPREWKESIVKAAKWIEKKRLSVKLESPHAGLLPSGFSAEHLGPNDFYYWDDFWGVAGLKAAAYLCAAYKEDDLAARFEREAEVLTASIEKSLGKVALRLKRPAMPASPYRRMDTGAVGSLAAGYPLRVFGPDDPRILDTAGYLMENCLVSGGFFHDMTHSGINPYLTLHLAETLLRAGDPGYLGLMKAVADLASPTGQWPESVHPRTGGGCMGDGQHVWAAAEWVLMLRNCFVREEGDGLILCSGIPVDWLEKGQAMSFGPGPTCYGDIRISIKPEGKTIIVDWNGLWSGKEPPIEIRMPGCTGVRVKPGTISMKMKYGEKK
ncbi:MAG: hypothetical protein HQL30_11675 [Candidatus Omnitrophica bacterium]|nr:hypothetical protein [Candidatus Omnitrophota bacterium]